MTMCLATVGTYSDAERKVLMTSPQSAGLAASHGHMIIIWTLDNPLGCLRATES